MTDNPNYFEIPGTRAELSFGPSTEAWQRFYAVLGYCINQWSAIDRCLFDACALCLDASEQKTAIIYYNFGNFEFRKKLVAELVAVSLGERCPKKQWEEILAEINRIQSFRNTAAHQPTRQGGSIMWDLHAEGGPKLHKVEHWLEITIEEKELLRGKKKSETVRIEDLERHAGEVNALHAKFSEFLREFEASPTRNKQSAEQDPSSSPDQAEHPPPGDREPPQSAG